MDVVLIVDDDPDMRNVLAELLNELGYPATTAADGREAVDKVAAGGISAILMDVDMPTMNGLDATRAIRAMADAPGTLAIIGHTGRTGSNAVRDCLSAGMNGTVAKGDLRGFITYLSRMTLVGIA